MVLGNVFFVYGIRNYKQTTTGNHPVMEVTYLLDWKVGIWLVIKLQGHLLHHATPQSINGLSLISWDRVSVFPHNMHTSPQQSWEREVVQLYGIHEYSCWWVRGVSGLPQHWIKYPSSFTCNDNFSKLIILLQVRASSVDSLNGGFLTRGFFAVGRSGK